METQQATTPTGEAQAIAELRKQVADVQKQNAELQQQLNAKPHAPRPLPVTPVQTCVNGDSGVAFSFASNENGISDVNVHINRSGQSVPAVDSVKDLRGKILALETKLELAIAEAIMGNNDPRITIPRRARIKQMQMELDDMRSQLLALQAGSTP